MIINRKLKKPNCAQKDSILCIYAPYSPYANCPLKSPKRGFSIILSIPIKNNSDLANRDVSVSVLITRKNILFSNMDSNNSEIKKIKGDRIIAVLSKVFMKSFIPYLRTRYNIYMMKKPYSAERDPR